MTRLLPLLLFLLVPMVNHAQSNAPASRVDTITAGYYYQPDSNIISFTVVIMRGGKTLMENQVTGNRLPATLARAIESQPAGTRVFYEAITVTENGVLCKRPSVVYVIGTHNTRPGATRLTEAHR